ncbi:hypothetical protein JW887_01500 [Candidatus Dojkabacteria bacterium]|nr:hypothetical protein [Candidatus Dojkabacteria bacterium]
MDETGNQASFEGTKVGVIVHFFDKISVAVVHPLEKMTVGDQIKIYDKDGNVLVEQSVDSMQVDGADITEAEAEKDFGMKVSGVVKKGDLVYKQ